MMPKKVKSVEWSTPTNWPAIRVELRPLSWIKEYESNPRTHPVAQIELIARSMREVGVTMPILVDEAGVIIAGHGRRLAALQNGYDVFPVVIARGWSDEKKVAERIKDNSYGLMSGWDKALLRGELVQLKATGFDMELLGFGDAQLVQFTTLPGPPSEFASVGENVITHFCCPRCKHEWSGDAMAGKKRAGKGDGVSRPKRRRDQRAAP